MKTFYIVPGLRLQILNVMYLRGTSLSTYAGIFVRGKKKKTDKDLVLREFQNPPAPWTKSSFNYTRVVWRQWRGRNMRVPLISRDDLFALKESVPILCLVVNTYTNIHQLF